VPVAPGDVLPELVIEGDLEAHELAYLGLKKNGGFRLTDIDAELVIVELMSTYCQSCQSMAPYYDALYDAIEADDTLRGRVKIIAIGLGNNAVELAYFRKEHGGKFPLFPDPDFKVLDAIGETRTPLAVFVRKAGGRAVVTATKLGYDPDGAKLEAMVKKALAQDLAALGGGSAKEATLDIFSVISRGELLDLVKAGAAELGGEVTAVETLALEGIDHLYSVRVKKDGEERRLFAKVGSGVATCDVCHDVYFVYFFDRRGKILNLAAVQLSKYGNEAFDEQDMAKVKRRLVGKYVFDPFRFDAKVDSITSATITASVMFRTLEKSRTLFERLERAGYLK